MRNSFVGQVARCLMLVAVIALATERADAATLYGADGSGGNPSNLYILDPATGAVLQTVGAIGFAVTGLAVDPTDGTLYGSTAMASGILALVRIDKATGAGTLVGPFNLSFNTMADIAFLPDGTLIGWAEPFADDLATIDKTTGQATIVGDAGVGTSVAGLAVDSSGTVYFGGLSSSFSFPGGLITLDATTGAVTGTVPYSPPLDVGMGLAFDPADVLYGIERVDRLAGFSRNLVTIDATSGAVTVIGATVNRLDALAFDREENGETQVPFDIRPQGCRNALNSKAGGVLPAAILGTADFDVRDIDPDTLSLAGAAPQRFSYEDVATPFEPFTGKEDPFDCTTAGPDGFEDLTLTFDNQEIIAALGPVARGAVLVLEVTGELVDGTPIVGEDVVVVIQ